jgi:pimeloyl-ACP methyl ester carboxylesterase
MVGRFRKRGAGGALGLTAILMLSGCSCRLPAPTVNRSLQAREPMNLNHQPFELRMFNPLQPPPNHVLIVYATGDGGWFGLGTDLFNWLQEWNYPAVGFSSRSYLKNLARVSDTVTTTPARLAQDYAQIIGFAESRLGLPSTTPVILVGLSRGAGLSVVAAGEGSLDSRLAGVLAIALTKEEEHVVRRRLGFSFAGHAGMPQTIEIQTYTYLNRFLHLPVMVIQSTRDGYLPAARARELFGPDTPLRRLISIEAANHSFGNACPILYQDARLGLEWITALMPER